MGKKTRIVNGKQYKDADAEWAGCGATCIVYRQERMTVS